MSRTFQPLALVCVLSALACLAPAEARARPSALQPGAPIGFTLGSGVDLLSLRHFPDVGFDVGAGPVTNDLVALASLYSLPVFHGGVVLPGGIVVGANLELAFIHNNPDGPFAPDTNVGLLGLVPFFEYWFDGEDMAPYVGAQFGPSITVADGIDSQVWLTAGARGGLHFFVGDSFSVGPTGQLNFIYRSDNERAGWEVVLGISLRGWMGGGGGGGGAAAPAAEPVPADSPEPTWQPPPEQGSTNAPPPPVGDPEGGLE